MKANWIVVVIHHAQTQTAICVDGINDNKKKKKNYGREMHISVVVAREILVQISTTS